MGLARRAKLFSFVDALMGFVGVLAFIAIATSCRTHVPQEEQQNTHWAVFEIDVEAIPWEAAAVQAGSPGNPPATPPPVQTLFPVPAEHRGQPGTLQFY